jgi:hypothetical protein
VKGGKIVTKWTVKNPPKNRGQTTFEGQKVPQNKQIANRTRAKKGSKIEVKKSTKNRGEIFPKISPKNQPKIHPKRRKV